MCTTSYCPIFPSNWISGAIIESLRTIQREMDRKNGAAGIDMGTVTTNGSVAEKLAEEEEEEEGVEADPPRFTWFCKGNN